MNFKPSLSELLIAAFLVAGIGVAVWQALGGAAGSSPTGVPVQKLSPLAQTGKRMFDAQCAACHGTNGSGSDKGPPLMHDIYNPGHHPDESFRAAVRQGVRQHHWNFGDMPPLPQVSDEQLAQIVRYMRELQLAHGITYRQHRM